MTPPATGTPTTDAPATTPSTSVPATIPATLPALLPDPIAVRAPAIGMSSPLQHMGLQADDGGVEVPEDFAVAGWYRGLGRPGGPGPTVLVGHVDSRSGPAVFYGLRDLDVGDLIDVTVADGGIATYAVTHTQQFPKAEFPTFEVFGATEGDVLRLVTCTGEFNEDIRSYYDNLVVTATRVS
ncbi:MAG: class F sortase [Actinomycetota bacterium]|nr:class F sortase [Actinomycetota bacterium]